MLFLTLAFSVLVSRVVCGKAVPQVAMVTIEAGSVVFTEEVSDVMQILSTVQLNGMQEKFAVLARRIALQANGLFRVDCHDDASVRRFEAFLATDTLLFLLAAPPDTAFDANGTTIALRIDLGTTASRNFSALVPLQMASSSDDLVDVTTQTLKVSVLEDSKTVGTLTAKVLFVTGVDEARYPPSERATDAPNRVYEFGHRGSGNSFDPETKVNATNSFTTENSIGSLRYAARYSDFVEFDAQVSDLDRVPFLLHDFYVASSLPPSEVNADPESAAQKCNASVLPASLQIYPTVQFTQKALASGCAMHYRTKTLDTVKYAPSDPVPADFTATAEETRMFPTLDSVLKSVDPAIGFNIEFKYPLVLKDGSWNNTAGYMDRNVYVDTILKVLLDDAEELQNKGLNPRRVVLGSFDPDMCLLISLKQSLFPVVFIAPSSDATDWRLQDVTIGTAYASAIGLSGVLFDSGAMPSYNVTALTEQVKFMKSNNLFVWTWGRPSDDGISRRIQIDAGIDGICMNRIYKIKTTPYPENGAVTVVFQYFLALICLTVAFALQHRRDWPAVNMALC